MRYKGVVRQGKVELPRESALPEGTQVQVEAEHPDWQAQWECLAREIGTHWQSPQSALEILREGRR